MRIYSVTKSGQDFFRNKIKQTNNVILTKTAKALDKIIGISFCKIPYQTHKDSPHIRTNIITHERSSTFFSLMTLMSCGIIDTEVSTPATIPKVFTSII